MGAVVLARLTSLNMFWETWIIFIKQNMRQRCICKDDYVGYRRLINGKYLRIRNLRKNKDTGVEQMWEQILGWLMKQWQFSVLQTNGTIIINFYRLKLIKMKNTKKSLSARACSNTNNKDICSYSTLDMSNRFQVIPNLTKPKKKSASKNTIKMSPSKKQKVGNQSLNSSKSGIKNKLHLDSRKKVHNFVDYPDFDIHIDEAILNKSGRSQKGKCIDLKLRQRAKKHHKNMSKLKANQKSINGCFLSARESLTDIKELNQQYNKSPDKQNIKKGMQDEIINNLTKLNQGLQQNIVAAYQKQNEATIQHQKYIQNLKQENGKVIVQKQTEIKQLFQRIRSLEEATHEIELEKEKHLANINKLKEMLASDSNMAEMQTKLEARIKILNSQLENKKLECINLASQKQSREEKLAELTQELYDSEAQKQQLRETIKYIQKDNWNLKSQMNVVLKENCQLREIINKNKQEKKYVQQNLYEVLEAVRGSMAGCIWTGQSNKNKQMRFGNDVLNTTKL